MVNPLSKYTRFTHWPLALELAAVAGLGWLGWQLGQERLLLPWPGLAVWLTVGLVWLLPGFVLLRMVTPDTAWPWFGWLPLSFGLGLVWLMLPVGTVFYFNLNLDYLVWLVPRLNSLLLAAYVVLRLVGWLSWPATPSQPPPTRGRSQNMPPAPPEGGEGSQVPPSGGLGGAANSKAPVNRWLWSGVMGMLLLLVGVFLYSTEANSFAGDDPGIFPFIQRFLKGDDFFLSFDQTWELLAAFVIRLSGAPPLAAYQLYLSLLFLIIACLAYMTLAEALFADYNLVYFSFMIFGLYALSDIRIWDGLGLGLLTRLLEDKFFAWLLVLPLAQAAFLRAIRRHSYRDTVLFGLLALVAVAMHPIAATWILFSIGAFGVVLLLLRRERFVFVFYGAATLLFMAIVLFAWWQRSQRNEIYFEDLSDPANLHQIIFNSARWVIFFSLEGTGEYMAHPLLLSHPLVILSLAVSVWLLFRIKRSFAAQFLFSNMAVVLLLLFNPVTASLIGQWIGFYQINRATWVMPVSLTLGYGLYTLVQVLLEFISQRLPWLARHKQPLKIAPLIVPVILSLVVWNNMAYSWRMLRMWNTSIITPSEQRLIDQANQLSPSSQNGILLPPELYRFDLLFTRGRYEPNLNTLNFVTETVIDTLRVSHLVVRTDSRLAAQFRFMPGPFQLVYQNPDYALYAWHPGQMTGASRSLVQANTYLLNNNFSAAADAYQQVLRQEPDQPLAILGLGAVYEAQRDFEQALSLYRQVWLHNPLLQLGLAVAHDRTGSDPGAIFELFNRTLEANATDVTIYNEAVQSFSQLSPAVQQSSAGQAVQQKLIDFFRQRAEIEPYDYARQQKLAAVYQQLGLDAQAMDQYRVMIWRFPGREEPYVQLAELFKQHNGFEAAAATYQEAIAMLPEPGSKTPYLKLAQLYREQEAYAQALTWTEQARQRGETLHDKYSIADAHMELGYIYQAQEDYQTAVEHFRLAAEIVPETVWYQNVTCQVYLEQLNDPTQALPFCQTAAELAPEVIWLKLAQGTALLETGQTEAGLKALQQALLLAPHNEYVYQQVKSLIDRHIPAASLGLRILTELIDLAPDDPQVYLLVGRFLTDMNDLPRAAAIYHQALERGLTAPEIYRQLAATYERLGQPELAQQYYKLAQTETMLPQP